MGKQGLREPDIADSTDRGGPSYNFQNLFKTITLFIPTPTWGVGRAGCIILISR